jgi:inosine/xanthosine triphosphatase
MVFNFYRNCVVPGEGTLRKVLVGVGTANDLKVRAVTRAFNRYFDANVKKIPVKTSVPRQPVGTRQVLQGALERAVKALDSLKGADFGVGIEAGLIEFYSSTGFLETQIAIILGSNGRLSVGLSPSFELPPHIVDSMIGGLELSEASKIFRGERDLGETIGYIGVKTWGSLTREEITEIAVKMALLPWLEGGEWLITLDEFVSQLGLEV